MLALTVILDGEGCWPDLQEKRDEYKVIHVANDGEIQVAALSGGTTSGRPSVMIRIDLPDGRVVLAETSMRLFLGAAAAFSARYREEI